MDYTYSRRVLADDLHIQLFVAETIQIGSAWNSENVQSAYWRFYRNDRDGAWLDLAGRRFALEAGRCYFVPAGVRFTCGNSALVEHFYVHFDLAGSPPILLDEWLHQPICLPHSPELNEAVDRLSASLRGAEAVSVAVQCRIKAMLYEAFALHIDTLGRDSAARAEARAALLAPVMPALRYIEREMGAAIDNEQLAGLCFMSEDHFIRRFKLSVGKTPAKYLTERRVTTAAQRLRFSDWSIDTIAERTGFGSRFYFSRVFTREIGVTPARYRRGGAPTEHLDKAAYTPE